MYWIGVYDGVEPLKIHEAKAFESLNIDYWNAARVMHGRGGGV